MSNGQNSPFPQPEVPSESIRLDWALIFLSYLILIIALIVDIKKMAMDQKPDWFSRAGGVTVVIAAFLANRSLKKHHIKYLKNTQREKAWDTSAAQKRIDNNSLILMIIGTLVWALGDKVLQLVLGTQ